ncbi:MAG: amino acid permease [Alphaproteobacteria bacterium]|jgi:L-asparagine transporter-like permease|nr:amino acid permease [Alphaproteobacteria bacterium]
MTDDAAPTRALAKDLKQRHVTMISIGGIIGAGLFVGSSSGIATIGPAVVLSYLLAGGVVLMVMRMLGEMAAAFPNTGAFTEFARMGLGHWAGFVAGWLYWYFWVVVVCVETLAGAGLLHQWIALPVWAWGLILLALMMATNLWSAKSYGEFEFWFASIKVVAIVLFIGVAAVLFGIKPAPAAGRFANLYALGGFAPFGAASVLGGVTSVIFALTGAEIATVAAAESAEPGRAVARMTSQVVTRILLFYVLSILLIVIITPWTAIKPGDSPFAITLERLGVPYAPLIMNLIILTAVLSCLNSGLYVASRVLFTLAAHGDAPQGLVKLNARRAPARAILAAAGFGVLAMAISVLSPQKLFAFLVDASGALMLIVYLFVALAQIQLRRRLEAEAPEKLVVRMWAYPLASWASVGAMVAILAAMALLPASRSEFLASTALLALSLIVYWVFRRGRGVPAG